MPKKQTLTFSNPSITTYEHMIDQIAIDIDDTDFINYIQSLPGVGVPVSYDWDDATSTMTVIRTWDDATYDDYMATRTQQRDDSEARLIAAGYELTEVIEDL